MADAAPADPSATQNPDPIKARDDAQTAQRWIAELGVSEKFQRKWLERARKIAKRYKDEQDESPNRPRRFAILWSNTQTVQPAIYTRPPTPVVIRRFDDDDPVARVASEVLERALAYSIDCQDLDGVLKADSFDFTLYGRGVTWERYEPTFGDETAPEIALQVAGEGDVVEDDQNQAQPAAPRYLTPDGQPYEGRVSYRDDGSAFGLGQPYRPVTYEESCTDYVNWEDFGCGPGRTWGEVGYVWRRIYLSRKELIARFGENLGKLVPLDWGPIEQGSRDESARLQKKAAIYEIWSKADKKVYWVSKSWSSRPLDVKDDPLKLPDFFPCPRPLLATTANDSVMPIPDFVYYQDQAQEIDSLTARIGVLQKALKVRGFYAGDGKSNLNNLLNSDNSILIPVPDWQSLKEDGGLRGKIEWFPIDQVVAALNALLEQRQQLINDVYQITGVADLLRGQGQASATATAEGIKAQWGTLRIRDKQLEMMRFARDILRIKGNVIAGLFSYQTLAQITGVKLPTNAEKQQAQAQIAQAQQQAQIQAQQQMLVWKSQVQQAQATGQQPPPQPQPPQPPQVPPQVQDMLDSPSWEDVEALLQNRAAREFRIEIETDSTIEPNEQQEKAQVVEFMGAVGQMIAQWGPAIQAQPLLAPMAGAFIKYGVRKFRAGRELEAVVDKTVDQLAAQPAQPQGQPQQAPPDPAKLAQVQAQQEDTASKERVEMAKLQSAQTIAAGEQAIEGQRVQIEGQKLSLDQDKQQMQAYALARDPHPQAVQ